MADNPATSLARSFWDKAYDALAAEKESPIPKYEDVVLKGLLEDDPKAAKTSDTLTHHEKLDLISKLGLKHIEERQVKVTVKGHEIRLEDAVASAANAVKGTMDFVSAAVGSLPYAAVVIAGVSLVLPLLTNPPAAEAANQDGFARVTTNMEYYIGMEPMLLGGDITPGLRSNLEERLVGFYKLIIDFQVRSVLRFYRRRAKNFLLGVINYEGWDKKLQAITDEENDLVSRFKTVLSAGQHQQLQALVEYSRQCATSVDRLGLNLGQQIDVLTQISDRYKDAGDRTCLQDLRTTNPCHDKIRIEETRGGLLADSYRWILESQGFLDWRESKESKLLWIRSDPGKGKTMLLCGIINELQAATKLVDPDSSSLMSYFFCQATDTRLNSASAVLRGLIFMLVAQQPALLPILREQYDDAGASLFTDANSWTALTEIFKNIIKDLGSRDPAPQNVYLFIDALDECGTATEGQGNASDDSDSQYDQLIQLLNFLIVSTASKSVQIKCIVTSRNWHVIEEQMNVAENKVQLSLELNENSVLSAVEAYIRYKVDQLTKAKSYDEATKSEVLQYLVANADGTFLWVALVCQRLASPQVARRHTAKILEQSPPGLDGFYKRMLQIIEKATMDKDIYFQVLAFVSLASRPLALKELMALVQSFQDVGDNEEDHIEIIESCGSFLALRNNIVYWVHKSAKDFFGGSAAAQIYPSGIKKEHKKLFQGALFNLQSVLRRNIGSLPGVGSTVDKATGDALTPVQYSCVHWVDHFLASLASSAGPADLEDSDAIYGFFQSKFLNWLEALSLLGSVPSGVVALGKLRELDENAAENLNNFVADAFRFLLNSQVVITAAPLQVYASALLFCPNQSQVYQTFKVDAPDWVEVVCSGPVDRDSSLQMLEGHSDFVKALAFSPDGKRIVSGSDDATVKIWDLASNACVLTLKGHKSKIKSVAFSPLDGKHIASGSVDCTIMLWDAVSGRPVYTFEGHKDKVKSIAFSPSGKLLASGSKDNTIKLWDVTVLGACKNTLEGHSAAVLSVAFSPDNKCLVSGARDATIRLWSMATATCIRTIKLEKQWPIRSVTFSPDGKQLAAAAGGGISIWDTASSECVTVLECFGRGALAYSPDGKSVAINAVDRTLQIWDIAAKMCTRTFRGHIFGVASLAFTTDGKRIASGSLDQTIRIWDVASATSTDAVEGHTGGITSLVFSPDGKQGASGSEDCTVRIWDTESGMNVHTLLGHGDSVDILSFSSDGKKFASASFDGTTKIWETTSFECVRTLQCGNTMICIELSSDGKRLASAALDKLIKVWDTETGAEIHTLQGHTDHVKCANFSPDGSRLASGSLDQTIRVWDMVSGSCMHTLEGHNAMPFTVAFSSDGNYIVSAPLNDFAKIWNARSGACIYTLHKPEGPVTLAKRLELVPDPETCLDLGQQIMEGQDEPYITIETPGGEWVRFDGERVLRFPTDFRPMAFGAYAQRLCVGDGSGRVFFLNFSNFESVLK